METMTLLPSLLRNSRTWGMIVCLIGANAASAQVTAAPAAQDQATAKPLPGNHGWANFTTVEKDQLKLTDQQFVQLHAMDDALAPAYNAMGIEPWMNEDFPALNKRRDNAIQNILTPEQYKLWSLPSPAPQPGAPTIMTEPSH